MGVSELLNKLRCFFAYWYMQYELNTALYMLEPAEKTIINTIAVAIVGLIMFAALTYLPGHLIMMVHFLGQIPETPTS